MIKPLPLGKGVNLDVAASTVKNGLVSLINAYADRGGAIRTVPGCAVYGDTGTGAKVWSWYSTLHERLVVVSAGRVFVKTSAGGALTEVVGFNLTADYPPTFAQSAGAIFIAARSKIHMLSGLTVTELGANSPTEVTSVVYHGGYLMSNGQRAAGAIIGGTNYSDDVANDYAAWEVYDNESQPDALQALVVAYEQIYNIGRSTVEVSYIDGTVPFSVNKNATQHFGTMAPLSVAFDGETIYYLSEVAGSRKVVAQPGGGAPSVISFPIDVPLERFECVDDAEGFIMAFRGQNGYAITFPSANCQFDEQQWGAVTLFYHLQSKEWFILGKWDADAGVYGPYRGTGFTYVEAWGARLIGGRDGKLYQLVENTAVDYVNTRTFEHRWRDNGNKEWRLPRAVSLGTTGQYRQHPSIRQCGRYRSREHEIIYTDTTDAGNLMRAAIRTGAVTHGSTSREKYGSTYRYDVECGTGDFVLNTVEEEFEVTRR